MGVFAPATTPPAVVGRLDAELVKIAKAPDFAARLAPFGVDTSGLGPAPSQDQLAADLRAWQSVLRELSHVKFE